MNRRSFVQTLGAGAVGFTVLEFPTSAAAAQQAATAPASGAAAGAIRIGSNENAYGPAASGGNRYPGQWVAKYPNVIVARTFSKIHAMAGMMAALATPAIQTASLDHLDALPNELT